MFHANKRNAYHTALRALKGFCQVARDKRYFLGGRRGGLMVGALDSGSNGPGSSPGQDTVVFLGKTLYFHSASLHPGV